MHKNNIQFVHTYNADASVFMVRSPERSETTDYEECLAKICHVDQTIVRMIDLFEEYSMLK